MFNRTVRVPLVVVAVAASLSSHSSHQWAVTWTDVQTFCVQWQIYIQHPKIAIFMQKFPLSVMHVRLKNGLLLYLIPPGMQVYVKLKYSFTSKLSHTLEKQFHFETKVLHTLTKMITWSWKNKWLGNCLKFEARWRCEVKIRSHLGIVSSLTLIWSKMKM